MIDFPIFQNLAKFEYASNALLLIDERGVRPLKAGFSFESEEKGLIQKVEIQTKKMMAVMEAETIKAIIFLSARGFFLNLSMKSNII